MLTFLGALVLLVVGYLVYGKIVDTAFAPDDRETPAIRLSDGVDYVPIKSQIRVFMIQLLNIAGLGPIFGAIAGALWGPVVYIWIVLGSIFAGGVHDYLSGMVSMRHNGTSISEIVGIYLGNGMKQFMRVFSIVLLVLVGTVFMTGPANLLAKLTPDILTAKVWLAVIIVYYFLATMLPIDQIIGKIYPLFGAVLLFMAVAVGGGLIVQGYHLPELTLANLHPAGAPIWPLMFITVACGAISGFHATQSPLMARTLISERQGRKVFYGAMIAEGIIALIWAAAGVSFYESTGGLQAALTEFGGQAGVVYDITFGLLGPIGGVLAVLGVVAAPITSGDTAFRSARLIIADALNIEQKKISKRFIISIPMFAIGIVLSQMDFTIIWRYFSWANQTLAMIALWSFAVYLKQNKINHWMATVPATFMTAVSFTYILQAKEGLQLSTSISYPVGIAIAVALFALYMVKIGNKKLEVVE